MNYEHIGLSLSRARLLSNRSSFTWAITDSTDSLLFYDAVIAGLDTDIILASIDTHRDRAESLFLSSEPIPGIVDIERLIILIEQSSIINIYVGSDIPLTYANNTWRNWCENWKGAIHTVDKNACIERINYGIQKVCKHGQPWVSCITSSNLIGQPIDLIDLNGEFGFSSYLSALVSQCGAVIYTSRQKSILELLPKHNNMGMEIEFYELEHLESLQSLLNYLASQRIFNTVVIGELSSLAYFINENIVDESIHHIAHKKAERESNEEQPAKASPPDMATALGKFKNWHLIASDIVGECSRLIFCRKSPAYPLRGRSN